MLIMSEGDWQSKFSSIVKETEINLERVKQKIGLTRDVNGLHMNTNTDQTLSLSNSLSSWKSNTNYEISTYPRAKDDHSSNLHTTDGIVDAYIPLDRSPSAMAFLNDKLEEQALVIEQLRKALKRNEEESSIYSRQLSDIKNEMNFLKSRSGYPRDMEASPDHHLEKWKRDVSSELQSLNRKFNQLNSRDEDTMVHIEDKNSSLASSISDLQRFVKGECQLIRQQMDLLHQRIGIVENEMMRGSREKLPAKQMGPWSTNTNGNTNADVETDLWQKYSPLDSLPRRSIQDGPSLRRDPQDGASLADLKQSYKSIQRKLQTLESNFKHRDSDFTDSETPKVRHKPSHASRVTSTSASDVEWSQFGQESSNPMMSDDYSSDDLTLGDFS